MRFYQSHCFSLIIPALPKQPKKIARKFSARIEVVMTAPPDQKKKQGVLAIYEGMVKAKIPLKQAFAEHPFVTAGAFAAGLLIVGALAVPVGLGAYLLASSFPVVTTLALAGAGALLLANNIADNKKVLVAQLRRDEADLAIHTQEAASLFRLSQKLPFAAATTRKPATKEAPSKPALLNYATGWKQLLKNKN